MNRRVALFLSFVLAATGCPPKTPGGDGVAAPSSGVPATGRIKVTKKPKPPETTKPVEEDPLFAREVLVELYKADMKGGETQLAAHKKHGLVDEKGKPVQEKVEAYEAAIKRFAETRPDEWSALADEVSVTTTAAPDVQKK